MPVYRAQVSLEHISALPEDRSQNNWHFDTGAIDPTSVNFDAASGVIWAFYEMAVAPSLAVSDYMSASLDGAFHIDWYDLDEAPPRVPVHVYDNTITPGGASLPSEVAAVLSMHGPFVSGSDPARRRGRIYVGPLSTGAIVTTAGVTRLESGFMTAVRRSARAALNAFDANAIFVWSVVSSGARDNTNQSIPYEDRPLLPRQVVPVVGGWVDNAIDIQRRRGEAATVRDLWDDATPA